ncbi:cellulose biosynthesis protein BcsN [Pararhizobium sp.]|uniref:cellulose biosynthesis protein BcsN n=1 Tax=Pararhizobium sp. TaxID=1977563 RepID=UPI00271E60A6|nr:cellulose biosynthesis protein BcsN [Pararhizobium sp.]MDO9418302.1 cellulose biosynthesis protein BcsN [Pararhizobium sp.]
MRFFLAIAALVLLTGCTTATDPFLETASISTDAAPLSSSIAPEFAAAYIPGIGGGIEGVRQTLREDYVEQNIVYENKTAIQGENMLTVKLGKPGNDKDFRNAPQARQILREIGWYFPGVKMSIRIDIGDNLHGAFGYATGPLGKAGSCIYGWQLAKSVTPKTKQMFKDMGRSNYAAQIRLRFCHPDISEDTIVTLMKGLRIKDVTAQTFDVLRYAAGSGQIGTSAVSIDSEPAGAELQKTTAITEEPAQEEVAVERRRTQRVVRETETEAEPIIRNAATVPLPGEISGSVDTGKDQPLVKPAVKKGFTLAKTKSTFVPLPDSLTVSSTK